MLVVYSSKSGSWVWVARAGVLAIMLLTQAPALADQSRGNIDAAPGTLVWSGQQRHHILCRGSGKPTVVLESGLGGTSLDWVRVQPAVAGFTRVCSYDRAGYGWSDRSAARRTAQTIAMELETLLGDASVAAPYILVGHSFGGLVVRALADRIPSRVVGLVLVDATHERQFETFASAGIKTPVAPTSHYFRIDNPVIVPENLPAEIKSTARKLAHKTPSIATVHSELRDMRTSTRQVRDLQPIHDTPALVVIAHDAMAGAAGQQRKLLASLWLSLQRELATRSTRGRFLLARESGHHVQLDQPALVVEAIRQMVIEFRGTQSCHIDNRTATC